MTERCPCDCSKLPPFTEDEARRTWAALDIPAVVNIGDLLAGMNEELEHCDITGGDPLMTAKIVLAHLREDPRYYEKLETIFPRFTNLAARE